MAKKPSEVAWVYFTSDWSQVRVRSWVTRSPEVWPWVRATAAAISSVLLNIQNKLTHLTHSVLRTVASHFCFQFCPRRSSFFSPQYSSAQALQEFTPQTTRHGNAAPVQRISTPTAPSQYRHHCLYLIFSHWYSQVHPQIRAAVLASTYVLAYIMKCATSVTRRNSRSRPHSWRPHKQKTILTRDQHRYNDLFIRLVNKVSGSHVGAPSPYVPQHQG